MWRWGPCERAALFVVALLSVLPSGAGIRCFEGNVTYCGINADGGALPGVNRNYVQGTNWACQDQQSDLDPTTIAPNCWDQATCEALQTEPFDDSFQLYHEYPYSYAADAGWLLDEAVENGESKEAMLGDQTDFNVPDLLKPSGTCPPEHPACGLQTYLRESKGAECEACQTRFRYSADLGAIYWKIWQIHKRCITPGQTCANSTCHCTTVGPRYYQGTCSPWAKSACRRKAYKCLQFPADYVVTQFQDYDIKFCTIGSDEPVCVGCVACLSSDCLAPVIHVTQLLRTDLPRAQILGDVSNYNCSMELCGEAPRTCWNETCLYGDDCWPVCDSKLYAGFQPGAKMGFYITDTTTNQKLVEEVRCCDTGDLCNYPNGARRGGGGGAPALAAQVVCALGGALLAWVWAR